MHHTLQVHSSSNKLFNVNIPIAINVNPLQELISILQIFSQSKFHAELH